MRAFILSCALLLVISNFHIKSCLSIQQQDESNSEQTQIHAENRSPSSQRVQRAAPVRLNYITHHRQARGTKRKNIFKSILRNPSLTRALTKIQNTKNKLANRLVKRKSKRKQNIHREKKPQRGSKSRPKTKSVRGNGATKVRGIIQDILHKPQRPKGRDQRKKKPRRPNEQHVRNKRRHKNRKRPTQGHRNQQRPYRETVKSQQHTTAQPRPTPPKPAKPTASDFYYKDISQTTPSSVVYTRTTTKASEKPSEYAFSENLPTVPDIQQFYQSEAIDKETPNYSFDNEGSKFFNNSEIFPQFIKNTVVEFSNPAGEDDIGDISQFSYFKEFDKLSGNPGEFDPISDTEEVYSGTLYHNDDEYQTVQVVNPSKEEKVSNAEKEDSESDSQPIFYYQGEYEEYQDSSSSPPKEESNSERYESLPLKIEGNSVGHEEDVEDVVEDDFLEEGEFESTGEADIAFEEAGGSIPSLFSPDAPYDGDDGSVEDTQPLRNSHQDTEEETQQYVEEEEEKNIEQPVSEPPKKVTRYKSTSSINKYKSTSSINKYKSRFEIKESNKPSKPRGNSNGYTREPYRNPPPAGKVEESKIPTTYIKYSETVPKSENSQESNEKDDEPTSYPSSSSNSLFQSGGFSSEKFVAPQNFEIPQEFRDFLSKPPSWINMANW